MTRYPTLLSLFEINIAPVESGIPSGRWKQSRLEPPLPIDLGQFPMLITKKPSKHFSSARRSPTFTSTMLSVFLLSSASRKGICKKRSGRKAGSASAVLFETVSGVPERPTSTLSKTAATV